MSLGIAVTISVLLGGYTGQRDQWEEHTYNATVALDEGGRVVLTTPGPTRRCVAFNPSDLEKAINFTKEHCND